MVRCLITISMKKVKNSYIRAFEKNQALLLVNQGYEKQFEEISATSKKSSLTRLYEIRRDNRRDQRNFFAGAVTMPLIGIFTAVAVFLLQKKALALIQLAQRRLCLRPIFVVKYRT